MDALKMSPKKIANLIGRINYYLHSVCEYNRDNWCKGKHGRRDLANAAALGYRF